MGVVGHDMVVTSESLLTMIQFSAVGLISGVLDECSLFRFTSESDV